MFSNKKITFLILMLILAPLIKVKAAPVIINNTNEFKINHIRMTVPELGGDVCPFDIGYDPEGPANRDPNKPLADFDAGAYLPTVRLVSGGTATSPSEEIDASNVEFYTPITVHKDISRTSPDFNFAVGNNTVYSSVKFEFWHVRIEDRIAYTNEGYKPELLDQSTTSLVYTIELQNVRVLSYEYFMGQAGLIANFNDQGPFSAGPGEKLVLSYDKITWSYPNQNISYDASPSGLTGLSLGENVSCNFQDPVFGEDSTPPTSNSSEVATLNEQVQKLKKRLRRVRKKLKAAL